jgi:hypothetical protein
MDQRNTPAWVTALLVLVGLALAVCAVLYFADPAKSLPSFFPGHESGSSHHHTKHGIAVAVLALAALVGAWISSGKRRTTA